MVQNAIINGIYVVIAKKSFVEQTGTILYGSQKDIEVWEKYIHCMIEKYPLHKCAAICNINLATPLHGGPRRFTKHDE